MLFSVFYCSLFVCFLLALQPQRKALWHRPTQSKGKPVDRLSELGWSELQSHFRAVLSLRCWTLAGPTTTPPPWTKSAASVRPWTLGWAQTTVTWWSSITRWVWDTSVTIDSRGCSNALLGNPSPIPMKLQHVFLDLSGHFPSHAISFKLECLCFVCLFVSCWTKLIKTQIRE